VNSQVSWTSHQPVQPCTRTPSHPGFRVLQAVPAMEFRVASILALFGTLSAQASGFPAAQLILSCLPMKQRVAPHTTSSGFAGDGYLGCPKLHILRRSPRSGHESPRRLCCLVAPVDEFPGCPGALIFRLCRRPDLQVAPNLASSALPLLVPSGFPSALLSRCASRCHRELPRIQHLPALPRVSSIRVASNPLSLGAS